VPIILYVVRSKLNKNLYYKSRYKGKSGGWVDNVHRASIWGSYHGPHQVLSVVGKGNAEIVTITGLMQPGEYDTVYAIRHRITGQFVANRGHRVKGQFYTDKWDNAGIWTRPQHAKALIRGWSTYCKRPCMAQYNITVNPKELEIIKMPIFIPPKEVI
jgi:hypothetical protein